MSSSPFHRCVLSACLALGIFLVPPLKASVYLAFANNGDTIQVAQGGSFQVTLNLTSTLEEVVGFDYFVQMVGVLDNSFILTGRNITASVFAEPIWDNSTVLSLPGAILDPMNSETLGAWTEDFSPVGAGTWQVAVLTISVNAAAPVGLYQFSTFNFPNAGWFGEDAEQHDFDSQGILNVEVLAVPEPAAGLLLLAGVGALVLARRRKVRLPVAALGAVLAAVVSAPFAAGAEDMSDYAKYLEYQQMSLPNGNYLNYRIAPPRNYVNDGRKYPLVIFWHGDGNFDFTPFIVGDPTSCNDGQVTQDGQSAFLSLENQAIFPCYLVLMQRQTKNGRNTDTEAFCAALVDDLVAHRNVDPDRVIVTGLSGGGGRTLACAFANPTKYAAIVPLSTIMGGSGNHTTLANRIKDIPAWFFHAANDNVVQIGQTADPLVRELRKAGGKPIYTRLDGGTHSVGLWVANYATPALVPWLAAQRRGQPSQQDPVRVAIQWPTSDPTITVSNTNVSFVGRVEVENPDGTLLDPLVTTISGTKIASTTSAIPLTGLDPWMATAGTVSVSASGTTALIAVARGRSWSTPHLGFTYYSDTLLANYAAGGDAVAPVVQITSPTTLPTWITKAGALNLAGAATDAVGVKAVEWSSNRGGLGTATGTTTWSATAVPLVTGTNVLTITARDAAGNIGQKSLTVIREGALPPDNSLWTGTDIGTTGISGNFVESNGAITIRGSGSGMWGTDNDYYFVHQPVKGDTTVVARIKSQDGTPSGENYAGWFISENLSSNSRYFFCGFAGSNRGVMRAHYGPNDTWGGSQNRFGIAPPYWIKLVRQGNSFSAYLSTTGAESDWTQIDTAQTIGMGQDAYVGFVVNSAATGMLSTAVFDNISITNGTAPVQVSAASRMTHGAAGDFDLDLPLAGTTGVESRHGSSPGTLSIRMVFDRPLASGSATVSSGVATVSGTPTVSGNALVVNLIGVADGQTVTLSASNVLPQGSGPAGTGKVTFRVLSGDVNASGGVTTADAAKVQMNVNKPLAAGNFGCDIDASGGIDATDFALTKAKLGTTIP